MLDLQNRLHLLYLIFTIVLVIIRIPYLGKICKVFYTMIHEFGHVMMTVITGGEVLSINLFSDTSGNTITRSKNKTSQFLIAIAGYPFAAIMAYVFFYLIHLNKTNVILFIFAGIALVEVVFWIRNLYGIIWITAFVILLAYVYQNEAALYNFIVCVFFSSILLVESIISSILLFFASIKNKSNAGDATNLNKITHVPEFIWALFFLLLNICFSFLTLNMFF